MASGLGRATPSAVAGRCVVSGSCRIQGPCTQWTRRSSLVATRAGQADGDEFVRTGHLDCLPLAKAVAVEQQVCGRADRVRARAGGVTGGISSATDAEAGDADLVVGKGTGRWYDALCMIAGGHRLWFIASMANVVVVYLVVWFLLPASVFWSPDEGAKFLQMYSSNIARTRVPEVPYRGRDLDPELAFYPRNRLYPQLTEDERLAFHWPPAFPFVSAVAYRLFGLRGIYVIPLVCGLAGVWLAGLLSSRIASRSGPLTLTALGLASPIFFYSMLFWEHTLAVCLGLLALWMAAYGNARRGGRRVAGWGAATLALLCAVAVRFDMALFAGCLALAGGVTLAAFPGQGSRRKPWPYWKSLLWLALACAVLLIAGAWLLPKLAPPQVFRYPLNVFVSAFYRRLRSPAVWMQFPSYMSRLLIDMPERSGPQLAPVCTLAANVGLVLALTALLLPRWAKHPAAGVSALLVGVASLYALASPERYRAVHALLLPAPYLIFALLGLQVAASSRNAASAFVASLSICYFISYVFVSMMAKPDTGGPEWGARYALSLYPLAGILAGVGFSSYWHAVRSRGGKVLAVVVGGVLLLAGLQLAVRGVIELRVTKRDLRAFEQEIDKQASAVVTDLWWLPSALAPCYTRHRVFTLRNRSHLAAWMERVGRGLNQFVYMSYQAFEAERLDLSPIRLVLLERKMIQGLHVSKYRIVTSHGGPPDG